ncbi:MAG TPA: HEAT repeat domain-containing protein [Planctomycetota bacterium]|nr:HEAT repeat domain-containing protein [Planctomycetota bacterium]
MKRWILIAALLAGACTRPEPPKPAPDPETVPQEPLRPAVVQDALQRYAPPQEADSTADGTEAVPREQIEALLETLGGGDRRFVRMAQEELAGLGAAALKPLRDMALDPETSSATRLQAATALGTVGLPAAPTLLHLAQKDPDVAVRRQAIYQLGLLDTNSYLPQLGLRLKYELDPENRLWLAWDLAKHGQGSALPVLFDLTRFDDEALRSRAQGVLADLETEHGMPSADLYQAWLAGSEEAWPPIEPSNELMHEFWLQVDQLSGEHFQLRGVDDARYALSQLGTWATPHLAQALEDRDPYVRLHTAQVLERMGPRARAAQSALEANLQDPQIGPTCAAALGALGTTEGCQALAKVLDPSNPLALRSAALRALGDAQKPEFAPQVEKVYQAAPVDSELRLDAALELLRLSPKREPLEFLVGRLPARQGGLIAGPLTQWASARVALLGDSELQTSWDAALATRDPIPSPAADQAWRGVLQQWLGTHADALLNEPKAQ